MRNTRNSLRSATMASALLISLLLGMQATAQVTTATIYGRVVDSTGAVVPAAAVTINDKQSGLTRSTTTNERGEFTLAFLPVGTYALTIEAEGFKTFTETGTEVAAGQKLSRNYALALGMTSDAVTVTAEAPLLNTTSAQDSLRLNTLQVSSLPMVNRDITSLLNLGTGVSANGTSISINGLPPRGFSFSVDGVDASPDSEQASLSQYQDYNFIKGVSVEAVREVEVAKNIFSAEIGNSVSGNVNLITKSGTNQLHGSVFEYYRSGGMAAVNHLTSTKTSLVYHQFGGSAGGPIIRDKVFLFAAYEGYRLNQKAPLTGNVPSRQIRETVVRALPQAKAYFDLWPSPTEDERPGATVAFFTGSGSETRVDDHGVLRGDFNISSKDRLTARYTRGHPNRTFPRLLVAEGWRTHLGLNENVSSSYTRVWNPALTSETRFGYNRSRTDRIDGTYLRGIPTLTGAGLPSIDGELFIKFGTVTSIEQTFSKVLGRHSLKYGGLFRNSTGSRINEEVPIYSFDRLQDILDNRISSARYVFMVDEYKIRRWTGGGFVQDDVRLMPTLTANLGIRYDYDSVPSERDNRIVNRYPFGPFRDPDSAWDAYYAMISPRVGLAWTPGKSGKTVIRAGFGVFFMPHTLFSGLMDMVKNGRNEPFEVFLSSGQLKGLGISYPYSNQQSLPIVRNAFIIGDPAIDPNREEPYSLQYTFGVQRQLANTLALDVSYVGSRGVKTVYSPTLNRVDRITGLPQNDKFGQFRYIQNADSVTYNSLQASLKKRLSHDLQFNVNYTYASNLSYYDGDFGCCGGDEHGPQDLDRLDLNRGPTPFHIQHRFITDFFYEVPSPFRGQGIAHAILGGWQLSGAFEARTGTPLLIRQIVAASPGQRPDFIASSRSQAIAADWGKPLSNGSYQYLVPEMFVNVPINPVSGTTIRGGTLSRYAIHGPGLMNVDMALVKNIPAGERRRIQFRGDFFNALNQTNFGGISTNSRATNFGRITGVRPGRLVQLSGRFEF